MSKLIFDLEANGFIKDLTKIHCISIQDLDTLDIEVYYEDEEDIYNGLLRLYNADKIIGHNIINFDIPAIQKLYPKWTYKTLDDTFLLSCILSPLRKLHSIESYSNGLKVTNEDWSCLTYNMLDRCVIDTIICTNIYKEQLKKIEQYPDWNEAIQLEYQIAKNHVRQVNAGVDIDIPLVHNTIECLDQEINALSECIYDRLPYRMVVDKHQFKKFFKKDGTLQKYVGDYFNK